MSHDTDRPDFLWDERLTRADLKKILEGEDESERFYYAAKILREARYAEPLDLFTLDGDAFERVPLYVAG